MKTEVIKNWDGEYIRRSYENEAEEISASYEYRVYDEALCRDGGSYYQPSFTAVVNGTAVELEDSSCGDFGGRYLITIGSRHAYFGSMVEREEEYSGPLEYSELTPEDLDTLKKACLVWGRLNGGEELFPMYEWRWLEDNAKKTARASARCKK